ncbi:hypothetical protein PG989_003883 [Apiospora arundinis]
MLLIAIVNIVTIRSNGDAQGGANEQINVAVLSQHLVDGSDVEPGSPARRSWPGLSEGAGHGREAVIMPGQSRDGQHWS